MFDQLLGLIFLGLGIGSPLTAPTVKGESTKSATVRMDEKRWLEARTGKVKVATRAGIAAEKHEAFREKLRTEQEKFRKSFEEHKASAEARMQTKKEAFEQKLAQFKDETRKTKLENIQERIEEHNTKLIDRATENLVKISELLDRIIAKVEEEKVNGKDTTAVDASISAAQTAITSGQNAISLQASKYYVVPVTTEEQAKSDTIPVTRALATDLKVMHEAVVAARKAVSTVIRELAKLRGEPLPEAVIK